MISGLTGSISRYSASAAHIDVGGVEYEVHVPLNVFDALQRIPRGEKVHLYVHHHFMQDEQRLFGFLDIRQRELFTALKGLKGLGVSLALSILSHLDGPTLLRLCETGDVKAMTKIPRVGKATAESVIFEINRRKERLRKILARTEDEAALDEEIVAADDPQAELAMQALLQLGYKEKEAQAAIVRLTAAPEHASKNASELIREALRLL